MGERTILLVDPEEVEHFELQRYFSGYQMTACKNPQHALAKLKHTQFDILVVDYRLPNHSGVDVFLEAQKTRSYTYGILLATTADKVLLEKAITPSLVQKVIEKPVTLRQFKQVIDEALLNCQAHTDNTKETEPTIYEPPIQESRLLSSSTVIGLDKGLRSVFEQIRTVAAHSINILITGETGTGKEVIARLLHNLSPRKQKPFIKVNCSAIPDHLLESELFGYAKGAFTGASAHKPGKIELAHKGTLFLDEIGEMKVDLQAKLLRVLQEKELERLGTNTPIKVDFRLITATNRDLREDVKERCFREDLYYRINTFPIHMPPLRERQADIPDLIQYFLGKSCMELSMPRPDLTETTLKRLNEYQWPGNVRELENAVKRAMLTSYGAACIEEHAFDFLFFEHGEQEADFDRAIEAMRDAIIHQRLEVKHIEKYVLNSIVEYYDGNVAQAVKHTGISKDKFYRSKKISQECKTS